MKLTNDELQRYARHLSLPNFGADAQGRLKESRVLIIGAGGLGCPLLEYLSAAGVGVIGVVDNDRVDVSNLQRQVIYRESDVGKYKVDALLERLDGLNRHVEYVTYKQAIDRNNAFEIMESYDVIADASDNFPTRYLVNDACVFKEKPLIYGAVYRFEGQVSVFNMPDEKGDYGPNYRDLYPTPPPPDMVPDCATGGVLGVLPGLIGSMQALEVIKVLTGVGSPLSGRLFVFDGLKGASRVIRFPKNPDNPLTGESPTVTDLIDYEAFCGITENMGSKKSINADELFQWLESGKDMQLIDVREPSERAADHIGGLLIPRGQIEIRVNEISRDKPVVVYCRSGIRSARAIKRLQKKYGFENLINLSGGIVNYRKIIIS